MSPSRCLFNSGNNVLVRLAMTIIWWVLMMHLASASSAYTCSSDDFHQNHTQPIVTNSNNCVCFKERKELKKAVDKFMKDGCSDHHNCNNDVVRNHGWPMGSWCVSSVTNMDALFSKKTTFNDDISSWDTSKVTSMDHMFYRARQFNQTIGQWDTSSVTSMAFVVAGASVFNQDLSKWDLSKVKTMYNMFNSALAFNRDISAWDTASVETMEKMFWGAVSFNQDLSKWDTSSVKDTTGMFIGASSFNQPLDNWDVSEVKSMHRMFEDASSFNQPLGHWNVSACHDMAGMFRKASSFQQDLSSWDVSKMNDADDMLEGTALDKKTVCRWGNDWKRLIKVDNKCMETKPTTSKSVLKGRKGMGIGDITSGRTLDLAILALVIGMWYYARHRNRSKRHSH